MLRCPAKVWNPGWEVWVNPKDASVDADATRFSSTHWSIVLTAAQEQTPAGQSALADAEIHLLCEALVAAQGHLAQ